MKKRLVYLFACIMALGISAFAGTDAGQATVGSRSREDVTNLRRSRPRKARTEKTSAPIMRVHAGDKQLYAFHRNAFDGGLIGWTGLVEVKAGATEPETLSQLPGDPIFQAAYMGDKALVVRYNDGDHVTYQMYDTESWEPKSTIRYVRTNPNILPYGMAYDHTTDKIYCSVFADAYTMVGSEDAQFGYINLDKADEPVTIINELPERMRAMTFDANGELYGLSFGGDLYKINKFTGEATQTGVHVDLISEDGDPSAPSTTYGSESMCCDWESGDFYISYGDDWDDTYVVRFNPTTGEAELVADYSYYGSWTGNILTGFYFIQSGASAAKGTPVAVSDLAIEAVGTEMKAKVSFFMPDVDTDGNAIDADMTWTVNDGNNDLATGISHSGTKVETIVEVATTGRVVLAVTATLDGETSNPASANTFIGCDVPEIFGLPTVKVNGQQITVKWNEANAVNGGNLDPVTYQVTRLPDNVVVAEAISETTFVDEITSDIKTKYSYDILPKSGDVEGKTVTSRAAYAGKYIGMPLAEKFEDPAMFLEYPIIDANNDDIIWDYGKKLYAGETYGVAVFEGGHKAADDYLLIGPFKMEQGAAYTFHMIAEAANLIETIEVKVGTNPTDTASFSTELIAPVQINPNKETQKCFDVSFEPETSGDYYFGIHVISNNADKVYVTEVGVTALQGSYPAAPADFIAEPLADSAVLTFTLPDKCIDGSELNAIKEARIYRDNALLATITEGIAPGATLTYVDDTEVSNGYHNYTVTAVNAESEGKYAACNVWRGPDYPARPTNVRFWEDLETPGLMHVTLDHAKRGFYGGYVNTDEIVYFVNYLVMGVSSGTIELGRGTDLTFKLPFNVTAQDVFAGSVYGSNSTGSIINSNNWTTTTCYFGPAMTLPLHDSWCDSAKSGGVWSGQNTDSNSVSGQSYWQTSSGGSQDGDGGFFGMTNTVDNVGKRALSPRVTLEGTTTPALVFYYRYTAQARQFDLEIFVDDQPVRVLLPLDLAAENADKWIRMEVPLTDYISNKYIQFGFTAKGLAGEDIARIDNLTISDLKTNDLGVISFSAPVKVNANSDATLNLTIRNYGSADVNANDYTVKFYKNDELLAELPGKALAADRETSFTTTDRPSVLDAEGVTYHAEIDYAADLNATNNTSARSSVRVVITDYPTVSDLNGSYDDGAITLTWSDPDMTKIPGVSTTESFESYEAFTIDNFGSWTTVDGDKANTVRLVTDMGAYDYPHNGEPMAWQVFNPAEANLFNKAWEGRSGSQFLVSFQAIDTKADNRQAKSDDWLISPELNGAEQAISFYSHAGLGAYAPELFDFMVSDKTTDIADFTPLAENVEVPYTADSWTEFVFRVPAGTRYFAIVHKSVDMFAMLVDDITYIPAGSAQTQLDLNGFNVYRNGKRITSEPIGENTFTDTDIEEGKEYTYSVSAIWDKGESRLSDSVTISAVSSLDNVTTYKLTVTGHKGFIRISGGIGEQAEIFNMAGARVATVEAKDTVDVPVASAGVYVVRAGGAVAKVIVR